MELSGGSLRVTVRAHTLLRDLCLFADRLAADLDVPAPLLHVDDMMLTLLPGESVTFTVSRRDGEALRSAPASAGAWPVLRSIGDSAPDGGRDSGGAGAGAAAPAVSVRRPL